MSDGANDDVMGAGDQGDAETMGAGDQGDAEVMGSGDAADGDTMGAGDQVDAEVMGSGDAADGDIVMNAGRATLSLSVSKSGDRPIQVGSHYHFAETNPALKFDRAAARGMRLDIAAGAAARSRS